MVVVFYDGWCPLCRAVAARTKKLGTAKKVAFVSFRDHSVVEQYHLSPELLEKMQKRMYVYDGLHWHEGIYAVYKLAQKVPAYWLFVPLLKLSIWIGAGQQVYDYIAKRRTIVAAGHCEEGACKIDRNIERK